MILQDELKAKDIRHQTMKTLQNHLTIEANGYLCQTQPIQNFIIQRSRAKSPQDLLGKIRNRLDSLR